jgi:hypothetical protein
MEEKQITGADSFRLIQQMIGAARDEHHEKGDGWLLWGWLLFIASVASVVLPHIGQRQYISWVWNGVLVLGPLLYLVVILRKPKRSYVKTYVQDLLSKIEFAFFVSLAVIVISSFVRTGNNFGYFYMLYAFWMYIHGSALKFKPLIIGAIINWVAAIVIFAIDSFYYDMMVSAVAVLFGYLVPGYLLKAAYVKKQMVK